MTGMEVDPLERVVTASTSTRLDLEQGARHRPVSPCVALRARSLRVYRPARAAALHAQRS